MAQSISVEELKARLDQGESMHLIDVRSAGEFAAGHVPRAVNIPLEQLPNRVDDLGQGTLAMLCQSGHRAGMACGHLDGVRADVLLVSGGTAAWRAAGYPVVASTSAAWPLERQVRLIAGLLVLMGTLLSLYVHPGWIGLAIFVGAGLTFAGATDICGMAFLLARLPWNRPLVRG